MRMFLRTLFLPFVGMLLCTLTAATNANAQTLTSDKADYAPGETVTLTGTGFGPLESISMRVIHVGDAMDNDTSADHQPWPITADGSGNFITTWHVPSDQDEVGATLLATADGSSGLHAETTFTDAGANLQIFGTDAAQHGTVGGAQNFGNIPQGTSLSLLCPSGGLALKASGGPTNFPAAWNLAYGGAGANNATLSPLTSLSPTSGSLASSSSTQCVSMTITTSSLTVGTTYTGSLQMTSPGNNTGTYFFKFTVVSGCTPPSLSETHVNVACKGGATGSIDLSTSGGSSPFTYVWTKTGGGFSAITQDISGLTAGTYNVTVTATGGCTAQLNGIVVSEPANALAASSTHTDVLCNGGSTGTVTVSATGGTAPYTGTGTFSGLSAGPYSYTVTDANGCTSVTTGTVSEPTVLAASSTHTDVLCNGGNTGTVTVSATGGTGPYTGTGTFSGLSAGPYSYTVTDAHGCTSITTGTVSEPTALAASSTHTDVLCNGGSTGTVTVSATGGTGPYTGTGTFSGLSAGPYSYTVTDANGCTSVTTGTVSEPTVLAASSTHTDVLCNGGNTGTVTVSATGGTGPYTGTGTFSGLSAGPYSYTVTDAHGCTSITTGTVSEPTALAASSTHTDVLCNGGSTGTVTVSATGGTAPYTGTGTFSGLSAGPYSYTVTDANGCTSVTTGTVSEPTVLAASSTHTDVLCNGGNTGTVTVSATGGTGPYTGTGTFSGLSAGPYSYTVTDAHGCTSVTTGTVSEPTALAASSTHTDVLCNGGNTGTVTVSATGGTGPYTGTGTFSGLSAGPYSYTVTDANGCTSVTTGTVSEPTVLAASSTHTDVLCNGGSTGTVTVSATGGTGPYTGTGTFSGLSAGPYSYTVTDANGCTSVTTGTVSEPTALAASSTHTDVLCNGGSTGTVTVSATGGTGPYTGTGTFSGLSAGPYSYTVTDAHGCTSITTGTVGQPTSVSAVCTDDNPQLYFGYNLDQNATVTVAVSGGTGPYTVSFTMNRARKCNVVNDAGDETWTGLFGSTINNSCPAFPNPGTLTPVTSGSGLSAGSYSVKVALLDDAVITATVTDAHGCQTSCSRTISAEDVRCFAGNSGVAKVTLCHKTGSAKNPIVTICVDQDAVAEHLAHGDCYGPCPKNATTCTPPSNMLAQRLEGSDSKLAVKIMPNPSVKGTDFTLTATGKTSQDVQIRVLNMLGKTVYGTSGAANQTYKFGGNFASGIYIVEVIQGTDIQRVKVVKQ